MPEVQGKASTRAKNKYRDKTYDRMELVLPKGKKEQIKAVAQFQGESVNAFVNRAIDEAIEKAPINTIKKDAPLQSIPTDQQVEEEHPSIKDGE